MNISAVIPTRNRTSFLEKTLRSLLEQSRRPDEILVIDSSDNKLPLERIKEEFKTFGIRWFDSPASVCIQRNVGIKNATGNWIFLCDDDIELPPEYLQTLESFAVVNNQCGVVAGRLMQLESGKWIDQYPVKNLTELLWRFVFQLPIWGDIDNIKVNALFQKPFKLVNAFYKRRGNSLTLAGWPLITQWEKEGFETTIFALGASLVRKQWLNDGYDEVLDAYGIGDNYGVALNFPSGQHIHVLGSTRAFHHRAEENRLDRTVAYYRRVLALHYFLLKKRKGFGTRVFFMWSLLGNGLASLLKADIRMFMVTVKSMIVIAISGNPYWQGHLKHEKVIQPFP